MPVDRPYVRVYQSIFDDPKFVGIVDDDHHLATWLRLLMHADPVWPLSAPLPATARKASVRALMDAGLVDVTGGRYRIHGLDSERERRASLARASADKRWSERNADALRSHSDSNARASASVSDNSVLEDHARDDDRPDLEAFLLLTRRAPTPRQRQVLDGLLDRHDLTGPKWAADIMMRNPTDPIGAVIKADKAWRDERIAEAQAQEVPKPQPRRKAGLPQHAKELLEEWAKQARENQEATS